MVFIVGAGASFEVGMPLGSDLKIEIAKALQFACNAGKQDSNWSGVIPKILVERCQGQNDFQKVEHDQYLAAARIISLGVELSSSIDYFVHLHRRVPKLAECAKLAIAQCILKSEKNSMVGRMEEIAARQINTMAEFEKRTWYPEFFRMITEPLEFSDLPSRFADIGLVIFNYDRCLEEFLLNALMRCYNVESQDAAEVLRCLEVVHAYGSLGWLDWQTEGHRSSVQFGANPTSENVGRAAQGLRTFTEAARKDSASTGFRIGEMIANARRVAMVGMAYHRQNIDILFPERLDSLDLPRYFLTSFGLSESEEECIRQDLIGAAGFDWSRLVFHRMKCVEFIKHFSRQFRKWL